MAGRLPRRSPAPQGRYRAAGEAGPHLVGQVNQVGRRQQAVGGVAGLYAEMWEFDDLASMEETNARVFAHETMQRISGASVN